MKGNSEALTMKSDVKEALLALIDWINEEESLDKDAVTSAISLTIKNWIDDEKTQTVPMYVITTNNRADCQR